MSTLAEKSLNRNVAGAATIELRKVTRAPQGLFVVEFYDPSDRARSWCVTCEAVTLVDFPEFRVAVLEQLGLFVQQNCCSYLTLDARAIRWLEALAECFERSAEGGAK